MFNSRLNIFIDRNLDTLSKARAEELFNAAKFEMRGILTQYNFTILKERTSSREPPFVVNRQHLLNTSLRE
jgi:hypothetical protein